jgi:hypothetical protein
MRVRLLTAVAVCAALTGGSAALAAPAAKPACNLVQDEKGDGTGFVQTDQDYLPNDPNLDLVSGDIASTAKVITAVIRTDAQSLSDTSAPTGRAYYANFTVGAVELFLSAALDEAGAATYSAGYIDTTRTGLGAVTGTVDVAKKEVRITAPISIFAEQASIKPGTKITDLNLLAQRYVGNRSVGGATPSADEALGGKTYVSGSRSCVVVGK